MFKCSEYWKCTYILLLLLGKDVFGRQHYLMFTVHVILCSYGVHFSSSINLYPLKSGKV